MTLAQIDECSARTSVPERQLGSHPERACLDTAQEQLHCIATGEPNHLWGDAESFARERG